MRLVLSSAEMVINSLRVINHHSNPFAVIPYALYPIDMTEMTKKNMKWAKTSHNHNKNKKSIQNSILFEISVQHAIIVKSIPEARERAVDAM